MNERMPPGFCPRLMPGRHQAASTAKEKIVKSNLASVVFCKDKPFFPDSTSPQEKTAYPCWANIVPMAGFPGVKACHGNKQCHPAITQNTKNQFIAEQPASFLPTHFSLLSAAGA
ncbi:MAG: hypothetical protein KDK05_22810, partial [Candidatus Competibacteraceae bacterium]|nr:hypothetical protein [Candidatus Competibacteraceae bacterium]